MLAAGYILGADTVSQARDFDGTLVLVILDAKSNLKSRETYDQPPNQGWCRASKGKG